MNPFGLVSSALNYLNPNSQGNIWNTPVARAIQQPLVNTQKAIVNTLGPAVHAGVNSLLPIANTVGRFVGQQPLFNVPQSPTYQQGARIFSNLQGANPNQPTALTAGLSGNIQQIPQILQNTARTENKNIFTPQGNIVGFGAVDAGGNIVKSAGKQIVDEALSGGSALAKEGINRLDTIVAQHPELAPIEAKLPLQPGVQPRGERVFEASDEQRLFNAPVNDLPKSVPQHQLDLEQAWKNNDPARAQEIINAIPANDPYKASMQQIQDMKMRLQTPPL